MVCIDIERLSRGSAMETGYIMQILQTNGCKIITPSKVYDLQNESNEQFTDMKFMFSRYELKTITKRLVRGRNQSAAEGKFMGSMAPYGYRPYKLPGEKGNSLMIVPEEAQVVSMIFDMYGQQSMGYNAIAYKLNDMHIPARKGEWSQTSVVNILTNEVYLGKIRWRRVPDKRRSPTAWYRCLKRGCDCKNIKCDTVEKAIYDAMDEWLEEYIIQLESDQQSKQDPIETALQVVQGQIAELQLQQENICEYLEKGIYTVDMFTKRNATLTKEIKQLQFSEADILRQRGDGDDKKAGTQLVPTAQHILDSYPSLTVEEKNQLWRLVLDKVTVYRSQDGELTVHLYPKLPGK